MVGHPVYLQLRLNLDARLVFKQFVTKNADLLADILCNSASGPAFLFLRSLSGNVSLGNKDAKKQIAAPKDARTIGVHRGIGKRRCLRLRNGPALYELDTGVKLFIVSKVLRLFF